MDSLLTRSVLGAVGFMILDGFWLGLVMAAFYRDQLAPIARLANGAFAPNWPAALVVYALLGTGIATFVLPRAGTATGGAAVALSGALFGLVVYGVYDFTNYATLRQWPFALILVDVAWGTVASALCAVLVWVATR